MKNFNWVMILILLLAALECLGIGYLIYLFCKAIGFTDFVLVVCIIFFFLIIAALVGD